MNLGIARRINAKKTEGCNKGGLAQFVRGRLKMQRPPERTNWGTPRNEMDQNTTIRFKTEEECT